MPELIQRRQEILAEKWPAATEEATFSGWVRQAIADTGLDLRELAERLGKRARPIGDSCRPAKISLRPLAAAFSGDEADQSA